MSWVDDIGLTDLASGVKSAATTAMDMYQNYAGFQMAQANTEAQIAINKANAESARQVALAQASWQQNMARMGLYSPTDAYNSSGITTAIGNMQRIAAGQSNPMNSMMLWLTVAGLALAWLTYARK